MASLPSEPPDAIGSSISSVSKPASPGDVKTLESPYNTISTIVSVSNPNPLGDPENGGALFTLPRELRDEIYRFVVKGYYIVFDLYGQYYCDNPRLTIFRVSQAISSEALEIFYSESVFSHIIDVEHPRPPLKTPTMAVTRMKNVRIRMEGITPDFPEPDSLDLKDRVDLICEATIDDLMGNLAYRDNCHVHFCGLILLKNEPLHPIILQKIATFTGFHTILVDTIPHMKVGSKRFERWFILHLEQVKRISQIRLEPTLGPAKISFKGVTTRLEFRPRQHLQSVLRAQAQKLVLDAERLV